MRIIQHGGFMEAQWEARITVSSIHIWSENSRPKSEVKDGGN